MKSFPFAKAKWDPMLREAMNALAGPEWPLAGIQATSDDTDLEDVEDMWPGWPNFPVTLWDITVQDAEEDYVGGWDHFYATAFMSEELYEELVEECRDYEDRDDLGYAEVDTDKLAQLVRETGVLPPFEAYDP